MVVNEYLLKKGRMYITLALFFNRLICHLHSLKLVFRQKSQMLPHFPQFKLTTQDYIMFSTDASNLSFTVCDHSPIHCIQQQKSANKRFGRPKKNQVGEVCGLTALLI